MKSKYQQFLKEFAVDRYLIMRYIAIAIFTILFTFCTTIAPQYQSEMVDALAQRLGRREFLILFFFFSILFAFKYIFEYINNVLSINVSERIASKVRKKISDKIVAISPKYFDNHSSGDVIAKTSKELTVIKCNGILMFLSLVANICTIVVVIPLMMKVNIFITLLSIISLIFYLCIYKKIVANIQVKSSENFSNNEHVISCLDESFNNWMLAKFYSIKKYHQTRFERINIDYEKSSRNLEKTYLVNSNISIFIMFISIISIWLIGGMNVINGQLSVGAVLLLSNYHNLLFSPMQSIASFANDFSTTKVALQRLYDFLDYADESSNEVELGEKVSTITLKNIGFKYKGGKILQNCNITFEAGKIYGISGASGSGKTTLIKLITKLLIPTDGEILINGICLNRINTEQYRKQVGYISVNNLFFSDSVYNNLVFDEEQDLSIVAAMCDNCQISDEIQIESFIEFKHKNISEGQARRLDMARALLKKPSVLILDEAMSSIDFKKRKKIFEYIRTNLSDFIVIVISHNEEDMQLFDYLYKINNGTIYDGEKNNE